MFKVFGGVGHGGRDAGAVGNGLKESEINLDIALYFKDEMERHGVEVKLSRYKDEDDPISEEIRECNNYNPDLAIDFHTNSGGGDGFEVYYSVIGGKGKILAQNIEDEVVKIGQNSRGTKVRANSSGGDYYAFIRETKCPANLVECAFIDNSNDIGIVDTREDRKKYGIAIAKGALKTLGIEYRGEESNKEEIFYRVIAGSFKERKNADKVVEELKDLGFGAFIDIYKK